VILKKHNLDCAGRNNVIIEKEELVCAESKEVIYNEHKPDSAERKAGKISIKHFLVQRYRN
jgi:hypothetical protein